MTFFLDVNLLLYAAFDSYSEHAVCGAWLEGMLSDSPHLIGFPTVALLGFVRISTQFRSSYSPITMEEALEQVERWIEPTNAYVPHSAEDHINRVATLLRSANGDHSLVTDAHLAALALEHQATMCSHDGDFRRFSALTVFDPLQPLPPII